MSRSYKHSGWIQDQSSKKFGKRFANKRVRRSSETLSGSKYKRIYQSWDISDYIIPCRGKIIKLDHRPGRKHRKVVPGGVKDSWWWINYNNINDLWKDWRK